MAVPVIESSNEATGSAVTNVDVSAPSGISSGDLGIMYILWTSNNAASAFALDESGWTEAVSNDYNLGGGVNGAVSIWYKHYTSAPPASINVSWTNNGVGRCKWYRISGHDTSPLVNAVSNDDSSSDTVADVSSITTTRDESLVIWGYATWTNTVTVPAGHTAEVSGTGAYGRSNFEQATAGATGDQDGTLTTNRRGIGGMVAIAPPPPPPPPNPSVTGVPTVNSIVSYPEVQPPLIGIWLPTFGSGTYTARGRLIGYYQRNVLDASVDTEAFGGYTKGSVDLALPEHIAEFFYDHGLAMHVELVTPGGEIFWEGFVNRVSVKWGSVEWGRGPLMDIGNRVSAIYTPILDTDEDPPVKGPAQPTPLVDNDESIGYYGVIEKVLSLGERIPDNAENIRDAWLAENAYPDRTPKFQSGSTPSVKLELLGYVERLDAWVYNNVSSILTTTSSAKVLSILGDDPNGMFTDLSEIDSTNLALQASFENESKTALSIIKSITAGGGADDARWVFGVYAGQQVRFREIDTYTDPLYARRIDLGGQIFYSNGQFLRPWFVRPGYWMVLQDTRISDDTALKDRTIFIERVSFKYPYDINVYGEKVSKFKHRLEKLGLGGQA